MLRKKIPSSMFISRKQLKYNTAVSTFKGNANTAERKLSELIQIESNNLNNLQNIDIIYEILIKIKKFKNYLRKYELNKKIILNILSSGVLKLFQLYEKVYKIDTYPQFYFLVLVGSVSFLNNNNKVYNPGNFFGEEIVRGKQYRHTAFARENGTILLLIPKEYFILYLKDNIIKAKEKIDQLLLKSFHNFKALDKYKEKMIKIYPETGQIIISQQDKANAIFIIFKGYCVLNTEKLQNLIILDEGDIFGLESLTNVDKEGNIMNNNFLYNIINKSPNTIILKFFITDLNDIIINSIKNQLSEYSRKNINIIQKHENLKEDMNNKLMNKFHLLNKKRNIHKFPSKSVYKELNHEKAEDLYNRVLKNIRFKEKYINDKQKLIPRKKLFFQKKENNKNNILIKIIKSNNFMKLRESLGDKKRKKIMSNLILKKDLKDIKKVILNSDIKKFINNNNKDEYKKEKYKNILANLKKNKKKEKDIYYNNPDKTMNILDNSNINSFSFTSVNSKRNRKNIYRAISIFNSKDNKIIQRRKIKRSKEEASKTAKLSIYKDSISYRNRSHLISAKKQIEEYECIALDSMNYFNHGEKAKSMNSSYYENKHEKINIKKCIFYETNKYNIPLLILLDEKEKVKFPRLINF